MVTVYTIRKFDMQKELDACVMCTWHNDRVVWGPLLVARCVEWTLHVDESMNEVVVILTVCMKHN